MSHSDGQLPYVGIVVVAFNHHELTRRCLSSLERLDYPAFVVVCVDNGSTDGTAERVAKEHPGVKLIVTGENLGYTGGNNRGIEWCLQNGCQAIMLLNNDVVVEPDALRRMAESLQPDLIIAPQIRSFSDPPRLTCYVGDFDLRRGIVRERLFGRSVAEAGDVPVEVGFAGGCSLLGLRDVFERVGLFDDRFFLYFEDADFLLRARQRRIRVIFEPRAIIFHEPGGSSGGMAVSDTAIYFTNRNRLLFMKKHATGRNFLLFVAYFSVTRLIRAVEYVFTFQWRLLRAMSAGIRDYATGRFGPRRKLTGR